VRLYDFGRTVYAWIRDKSTLPLSAETAPKAFGAPHPGDDKHRAPGSRGQSTGKKSRRLVFTKPARTHRCYSFIAGGLANALAAGNDP